MSVIATFSASPPIVTPFACPIFVDLQPTFNGKLSKQLNMIGYKGVVNEKTHHILGATKFEVHLHNF